MCAAPTGAANQALYGKMPSVTYQDFPEARLIILWGVNPSASGIHLIPYIREAQKRGAMLVVVDPRTDAAGQAGRRAPGRSSRARICRWRSPSTGICSRTATPTRRSWTRTRTAPTRLREKAQRVDVRARRGGSGHRRRRARARWPQLYATTSPALVKCGWGQERNRNGGSSSMAILALPAVAGKFGVRGGGYAMSNTNAWGIERTWIRAQEPATRLVNMNQLGRALTEYRDPPVQGCCSSTTRTPRSRRPTRRRCCRGLEREDLFTVVFDSDA